jgi:bifunctional UDP-N-acetylglucosamine pyrophosphorylase/glucosamine-1-phosphate N-acetyltransferase
MTNTPSDTAPPTDPVDHIRAQLEQRLADCARHAAAGVVIVDPATTYIAPEVRIASGAVIEPNTTITGATTIGRHSRIGPNTVLREAQIGERCVIFASVVEDSRMDDDSDIGPYSHLRGGAHVEAGVHLGNFVEIKSSRIGRGSKAGHFSYIGDADVGEDVNIGAGTVTCNYDGKAKHRTIIEDGAFIGSDTMLVAPVRIGRRATTGAGSVVNHDVPEGENVVGVPARPAKKKARGSDG